MIFGLGSFRIWLLIEETKMEFIIITPAMILRHPIIAYQAFNSVDKIIKAFDPSTYRILKVKYEVGSPDQMAKFNKKAFDNMLNISGSDAGKFLLTYVRARFGFEKFSSIKSIYNFVRCGLNSANRTERKNAQVICSLFVKFIDISSVS